MAWSAYDFMFVPISDESAEVIFEVRPGDSYKQMTNNLSEQGLIKDAELFYYYGRLTNQTTRIKVGEYKLNKNMNPEEILQIVSSGKSIEHVFTVQEGLNIFEVAEIFKKAGLGSAEEFVALCTDRKFVKELLKINANSLEGFLFPDTYKVTKYVGAKELITRMVRRFHEITRDVQQKATIKLPPIQWVTLASIIEKETGAAEERAIISSVLHNRLKKNMRLQMDSTTLYGLWRKTGTYVNNLRRQDLLEKNDYNTYAISGLPAGPISNPGRDSLWAALNPASTKYLYFVSHNDGTHEFSETFKEHNKAVIKYQVDRKAREGKSWRDRSKKKYGKN